jgi:hypothetical protein
MKEKIMKQQIGMSIGLAIASAFALASAGSFAESTEAVQSAGRHVNQVQGRASAMTPGANPVRSTAGTLNVSEVSGRGGTILPARTDAGVNSSTAQVGEIYGRSSAPPNLAAASSQSGSHTAALQR